MLCIRYLISYISNIIYIKYLFCIVGRKMAYCEPFSHLLYEISYIRYKISYIVYKIRNMLYLISYVI